MSSATSCKITFVLLIGNFLVVYMEDLLVFSKMVEEHIQHLRTVLHLLREASFFAKLTKCYFLKQEIHFLGYTIGADGVKVNPEKLQALQKDATSLPHIAGCDVICVTCYVTACISTG